MNKHIGYMINGFKFLVPIFGATVAILGIAVLLSALIVLSLPLFCIFVFFIILAVAYFIGLVSQEPDEHN